MAKKARGKGEGARGARFAVRGMNGDGDYVAVKEFNTLSHAINFANTWKVMGKIRTPLLVVDVSRNIVAFRV